MRGFYSMLKSLKTVLLFSLIILVFSIGCVEELYTEGNAIVSLTFSNEGTLNYSATVSGVLGADANLLSRDCSNFFKSKIDEKIAGFQQEISKIEKDNTLGEEEKETKKLKYFDAINALTSVKGTALCEFIQAQESLSFSFTLTKEQFNAVSNALEKEQSIERLSNGVIEAKILASNEIISLKNVLVEKLVISFDGTLISLTPQEFTEENSSYIFSNISSEKKIVLQFNPTGNIPKDTNEVRKEKKEEDIFAFLFREFSFGFVSMQLIHIILIVAIVVLVLFVLFGVIRKLKKPKLSGEPKPVKEEPKPKTKVEELEEKITSKKVEAEELKESIEFKKPSPPVSPEEPQIKEVEGKIEFKKPLEEKPEEETEEKKELFKELSFSKEELEDVEKLYKILKPRAPDYSEEEIIQAVKSQGYSEKIAKEVAKRLFF